MPKLQEQELETDAKLQTLSLDVMRKKCLSREYFRTFYFFEQVSGWEGVGEGFNKTGPCQILVPGLSGGER